MDEETAIIDSNTRNEKIRNFFVKNRKILSVIIIVIVSALIGYFIYAEYKENQKLKISDQYNSITTEYSEKNKEETKNLLIELIYKNDSTYSPLSLYFIIDNDIVNTNEEKLSIDQYLKAKHLRVAPMDAPPHPIDRALSQLDLEREIFVRIELITLAPEILKSSNLILTLPSETAERMAKNYNFKIIELPLDLEKRKTRMVWHKELVNHPTFDWIKTQIIGS